MIIRQPRGVPPPTMVNGSNGVPLIHTTTKLELLGLVAISTWKTVNVADWSPLSLVPANSDWLLLRMIIWLQATATGSTRVRIRVRKTGESGSTSGFFQIAEIQSDVVAGARLGSTVVHPVPLNPGSGVVQFDVNWHAQNHAAGSDVGLYIVGYGLNP